MDRCRSSNSRNRLLQLYNETAKEDAETKTFGRVLPGCILFPRAHLDGNKGFNMKHTYLLKREQIQRLIQICDNRVTDIQQIRVGLLQFSGQISAHPINRFL